MSGSTKSGASGSGKASTASGSDSIHEHATHLLEEAEAAAASVTRQVRLLFEALTHRVSTGTGSASRQPAASGATTRDSDDTNAGVLVHVREAGEAAIEAIGEGFETVRRVIRDRASIGKPPSSIQRGTTTTNKSGSDEPESGHKSAEERSASKKRKAATDRTAVSTKKNPSAKKKPSAKNKNGGKKETAKKKTAAGKKSTKKAKKKAAKAKESAKKTEKKAAKGKETTKKPKPKKKSGGASKKVVSKRKSGATA